MTSYKNWHYQDTPHLKVQRKKLHSEMEGKQQKKMVKMILHLTSRFHLSRKISMSIMCKDLL